MKLKITHEITTAIQVLRHLNAISTEKISVNGNPSPVVIAGGCIRDALLDAPIKDVDIFIFKPAYKNIDVEKELHAATRPLFNTTNMKVRKHTRSTPSFQTAIDTVVTVNVNDVQFDVVCTNIPPVEYVHKFSINLCKAYMHMRPVSLALKPVVTCTPLFMQDMMNKTITVDQASVGDSPMSVAKAAEHLKRVSAKYPSYRVIQ